MKNARIGLLTSVVLVCGLLATSCAFIAGNPIVVTFGAGGPIPGVLATFTFTYPPNSSATFFWEFGEGTTGTGNPSTHVYLTPATYLVKLHVFYQGPPDSYAQAVQAQTTELIFTKSITIGPGTTAPSDLILWYKFNEGSGTDAIDSSTFSNDGTLGGPTYVSGPPGPSGFALDFDGVNDIITIGDPSFIDGTPDGTIEFWVKINSPQNFSPTSGHTEGEIISLYRDDTHFIRIYIGTGVSPRRLLVDTWLDTGSINIDPDLDLPNDIWAHVALIWGSGGAKLYVNGILEGTNAQAGGTVTGHIGGKIGAGFSVFTTDYLIGQLDEIRIWNRVLDPSEFNYPCCTQP